MKRTLCLLLALALVLTTVGCGTDTKEPSEPNNKVESEKDSTNNTEKETLESESSSVETEVELPLTHKVPLKQVVISVPKWQNIEYGYTEVYNREEKLYIAFTYDRDKTVEGVKDAHQVAWDKFLVNLRNHKYEQVILTKEEIVTINGIEMYRYEGTMPYQDDGKSFVGYTVGYSFIMDGVPCTLVGSVTDPAQSDEYIKQVTDTVEAMIKTLRSQK